MGSHEYRSLTYDSMLASVAPGRSRRPQCLPWQQALGRLLLIQAPRPPRYLLSSASPGSYWSNRWPQNFRLLHPPWCLQFPQSHMDPMALDFWWVPINPDSLSTTVAADSHDTRFLVGFHITRHQMDTCKPWFLAYPNMRLSPMDIALRAAPTDLMLPSAALGITIPASRSAPEAPDYKLTPVAPDFWVMTAPGQPLCLQPPNWPPQTKGVGPPQWSLVPHWPLWA